MTESSVFDLILNEKADFPKLEPSSVNQIAKTFTDIIYDSLQLKLSTATEKRVSTLRFIRSLVARPDDCPQIGAENYHVWLESFEDLYKEDPIIDKLQLEVAEDLAQNNPNDLYAEIKRFNERKVKNFESQSSKSEIIAKYDQKFNPTWTNSIKLHKKWQNKDDEVIQLLKNLQIKTSSSKTNTQSREFREKQVELGYSTLNLHEYSTLNKIIVKIGYYERLLPIETNFIMNLSHHCKEDLILDLILQKFSFIIEILTLQLCSELVLIKTETDFDKYVKNRENNKKVVTLSKVAARTELKYSIKSIFYNLYCLSGCNKHIIQFYNVINR